MMYPHIELAKQLVDERVKSAELYRISHQSRTKNPREGVILPKLWRPSQSR